MKKNVKFCLIYSIAFSLVSGCVFFALAKRAENKVSLATAMHETSRITSDLQRVVENFNRVSFSKIRFISTLPVIRDPNVDLKKKAEQLFGLKDADPSLIGMNITDLQGNSWLVEGGLYNFAERPYFKDALQGKESIFGPIQNKVTNLKTIFYGAPNYDDEGNLINTFFLAVHGEALSNFCKTIISSFESDMMVIRRSTGLVIADVDLENVLTLNYYDYVAGLGNPEFHDITEHIALGKTGIEIVTNKDKSKDLVSYAPVADSDWSVIVIRPYRK